MKRIEKLSLDWSLTTRFYGRDSAALFKRGKIVNLSLSITDGRGKVII